MHDEEAVEEFERQFKEDPYTFQKPSELLETMHSHGIYDAKVLDECSFDTSTVTRFTPEETIQAIEDRGLGGKLDEGDEVAQSLIYGWTTAAALAKAVLGTNPGAAYHGRGTAFRASLAALKEAGF